MTAHRDDVNIVIVLKAMGVESDQEIVQLVGEQPEFFRFMAPALQHAKEQGVFTQHQALDWLGTYQLVRGN